MTPTETFENEFARLMSKSYKVPTLGPDTSLKVLDSLGITEACVLAEDHLGIELGFDEFKSLETYGQLFKLLNEKLGEPK